MPRRLILTRAFAADQAALNAYNQRQLGQREVAVATIVGSVGRIGARTWTTTARYRAIRAAMEAGKNLPPVDLYLLDGGYYILDGHHRVAAALALGALDVDATVTEFLPRAEPAAIWHRQHLAFERDTGLAGFHLRQPNGYAQVRQLLTIHCATLMVPQRTPHTLATVAADWARTIYRPTIAQLHRYRLQEHFPTLTTAELFLAFHDYATEHGANPWCGDSLRRMIATFAIVRRLPWLARFARREATGHRPQPLSVCAECATL